MCEESGLSLSLCIIRYIRFRSLEGRRVFRGIKSLCRRHLALFFSDSLGLLKRVKRGNYKSLGGGNVIE